MSFTGSDAERLYTARQLQLWRATDGTDCRTDDERRAAEVAGHVINDRLRTAESLRECGRAAVFPWVDAFRGYAERDGWTI
ncbi:MAG TPA: hypothetical protein VLF40_05290 [Candidatus Saccharimonadales bacterium]|nr:hypothetical protein [Candidatus Saccharimonadales bacterium]